MTAVETTERAAEPPVLPPIQEQLRTPPSGLGQMTFAEAAVALKHYRPVAAAILAILLLAVVLPGPRRVVLEGFSATSDFEATGSVETDDAEGGAEAGLITGETEPLPEPAPFAGGTGFGGGSFETGPSSFSPPPSSDDSGDFESDFGSSSSFSSSTSPTTDPPPRPLRVTDAAWASRTAGTPLAAQGVPEDTLPVGKRLGQDDKQSFVRLTGTATTLTLKLGPAEGQRSLETAKVQACKITDITWKSGEAIAWDDRPPYSTQGCVQGTQGADKTWTFDLSTFVDRSGEGGIALVPGPDAPLDFQVAFARS